MNKEDFKLISGNKDNFQRQYDNLVEEGYYDRSPMSVVVIKDMPHYSVMMGRTIIPEIKTETKPLGVFIPEGENVSDDRDFKLTNLQISQGFQDHSWTLLPSNFIPAFAYWITFQGRGMNFEFNKPIRAFTKYVHSYFNDKEVPQKFNYNAIERIVSDKMLFTIPEVAELNQVSSGDFIDLGALSRNIFFMILRNEITQPL